MKTLRLIVSVRLAFFPLIFNLSIAGELDISPEELLSRTSESEVKDLESNTPMDSSPLVQNDEKNTQDSWLRSEWQEELYLPNLKITEVYRLWSSEWIEITNLSDEEFNGTLTFLGANNRWNILYSDVNIQSYQSIIITSSEDIWMINWETFSVYPKNISITDGNGIYIELQYSWNTIDSFEVDEITVNQNKNKNPRPSFQKIYDNWRDIQITTMDDIFNITWFVANPWKLVIKSWNPWEWDWPSNWENPWTWDSWWTWNITWEDSDFNLIISEVFYDDDDEWIEIFNIWNWDFLWDLTLSWNIFSDNKNYTYQNIQIPANDFLIIADSNEMFDFSSTHDW